jgi:hypothetical protein
METKQAIDLLERGRHFAGQRASHENCGPSVLSIEDTESRP